MIIKVKIDNRIYEVEVGDLQTRPVITLVDGKRVEVWPESSAETGQIAPGKVETLAAPPEESAARQVLAPMPGIIASISVKEGDHVSHGQELCVLEAMKMKNVIRSPRTGIISSVPISVGLSVLHRDILVEFQD